MEPVYAGIDRLNSQLHLVTSFLKLLALTIPVYSGGYGLNKSFTRDSDSCSTIGTDLKPVYSGGDRLNNASPSWLDSCVPFGTGSVAIDSEPVYAGLTGLNHSFTFRLSTCVPLALGSIATDWNWCTSGVAVELELLPRDQPLRSIGTDSRYFSGRQAGTRAAFMTGFCVPWHRQCRY